MSLRWIRVTGQGRHIMFDPATILSIQEPIDVASGWKPTGWPDGVAAIVTVGRAGGTDSFCFNAAEWGKVRNHLRIDGTDVALVNEYRS